MSDNTTPKDVRRAKNYIYSRGLNSSDILPKQLAITSKKLGKPFKEILTMLAIVKMRGQGQGEAPLGKALARDDT